MDYVSKMLILVAGAAFNILFALVLSTILWAVGQPVVEEEQTTRIGVARETIELPNGHPTAGPAAGKLRGGDVIVAVDGKSVQSFSDIIQLVALGHGRNAAGQPSVEIDFDRDGHREHTVLTPVLVGEGTDLFREIGIEPAAKVTVAGVIAGMPAEAAGLQFRDIITHLDGKPVGYVGFISDYLRTSGAKPVIVSALRDGKPVEVTVTPVKVTAPDTKIEAYRLGLSLKGAFTLKTIHTAPWEQVWDKVVWTGRNLESLVNRSSDVGLSKMSSPIGIANRMRQYADADIRLLLWFVIFVNVNLAIFNLLPIPVLDGGQMLFATIGRLRRRELPPNVIIATQRAFFVLLMSMIIYVGFFDVKRMAREAKTERAAPAAPAVAPTTTTPPPATPVPPSPAGK
jgi:regulator of sigma E protease